MTTTHTASRLITELFPHASSTTRIPIVRSERIEWAKLSAARRTSLIAKLFAIFDHLYEGSDLEAFERSFFSRANVVVSLFYGADGRLGGYCSCSSSELATAAHHYVVFSAAVMIDPRYKGGHVAASFGLREALRCKLARPWVRVGYLASNHSPAPYALHVRTMPRVYPSLAEHSGEPSPEHAQLMRKVIAQRGWPVVGDDPYVVATPFRPRQGDWVGQSERMANDPHVHAYLARVPGWASEGHALVVWMPLDLDDIVRGALRLLGVVGCARMRDPHSSELSKVRRRRP